jgi:hypothetical protein
MSRRIKFRAWAVASRKMFYPDSSDGWELEKGKLEELPNTILEQFTGLCDKNGKEIYEGDVLLTDELGWIGQCIYNYDGFMLIDKRGGFSRSSWKNCEVIGNIHENPEALND